MSQKPNVQASWASIECCVPIMRWRSFVFITPLNVRRRPKRRYVIIERFNEKSFRRRCPAKVYCSHALSAPKSTPSTRRFSAVIAATKCTVWSVTKWWALVNALDNSNKALQSQVHRQSASTHRFVKVANTIRERRKSYTHWKQERMDKQLNTLRRNSSKRAKNMKCLVKSLFKLFLTLLFTRKLCQAPFSRAS